VAIGIITDKSIYSITSKITTTRPLIARMMDRVIDVPSHIRRHLNLMWVIFFIVSGLANLYVAGRFFAAEQVLVAAVGQAEIDLAACGDIFSKELLDLYTTARSREETWVNFKLFGIMSLTIAFVIAQGILFGPAYSGPRRPEGSTLICITPSSPRTGRTV